MNYHPDAMLRIAHDREAELLREAQAAGLPRAEGGRPGLSRRLLTGAMGLATLATLLWWLIA